MQDGLHIGVAAWIHSQRNIGSFPVYPAMPMETRLTDLESVQNLGDLAKAAEFARLVSFVPRKGQIASAFSESEILWRVHRDILARMDHAATPWTNAEQKLYEAARAVLYTDDFGLTPKYLLYREYGEAYQAVSRGGGSPSDIAQALSDWVILGSKHEVENALEDIVRLTSRSSRDSAQNEALSLNLYPPGVGLRYYGEMEFAPTYFAPISALASETWLEATVSFSDLTLTVGDGPHRGKWNAFVGNRHGTVSFRYVVVSCIRPWWTPALYRADDWRLTGSNAVVSQGNGSVGLLPAYVNAVYLVSINHMTIQSAPAAPKPVPILPRPLPLDLIRLEAERKPPGIGTLLASGPRLGVATRAMPSAVPTVVASTTALAVNRVAGTTPTATLDTLKVGKLRTLTRADLSLRYEFVRRYLAQPERRFTPTGPSAQVYVAGFGCEEIPLAPNPNVNYQW
jgi:hypothetical protein